MTCFDYELGIGCFALIVFSSPFLVILLFWLRVTLRELRITSYVTGITNYELRIVV